MSDSSVPAKLDMPILELAENLSAINSILATFKENPNLCDCAVCDKKHLDIYKHLLI